MSESSANPNPNPNAEQSFVAEYVFSAEDDILSVARARNISGDEAFYNEMNRVVGNLKLIRMVQPNCGTLVSYVQNAAGESFKIVLAP
jgi:hypothetical protein